MIKAYVVGIESLYEGEDIEIRYSIYKSGDLIRENAIYKNYKKPVVVTQLAIQETLKELKDCKYEDINIIINDGSTYALLNETSDTKNKDALNMKRITKKKLKEFKRLKIINVSGDYESLQDWNEKVTF